MTNGTAIGAAAETFLEETALFQSGKNIKEDLINSAADYFAVNDE